MYLCLHIIYMPGAHGDQKRALVPLELELDMAVSLRAELRSSARTVIVSSHGTASLTLFLSLVCVLTCSLDLYKSQDLCFSLPKIPLWIKNTAK